MLGGIPGIRNPGVSFVYNRNRLRTVRTCMGEFLVISPIVILLQKTVSVNSRGNCIKRRTESVKGIELKNVMRYHQKSHIQRDRSLPLSSPHPSSHLVFHNNIRINCGCRLDYHKHPSRRTPVPGSSACSCPNYCESSHSYRGGFRCIRGSSRWIRGYPHKNCFRYPLLNLRINK